MATKIVTLDRLSDYNTKIQAKYAAKTELPTAVSELTNDSGYQTASDVSSSITTAIAGKADSATTLAGYGITDAYTQDQVDAKISTVYKPAGSVAFADLPTPDKEHLGNVYNVTDAFTTTASFVEGAGQSHPAGTNVVVVEFATGSFALDVLAGFVDLTDYAKTADFEEVTSAEIDALFAE